MAIFRSEFDLETSIGISTYASRWIGETLRVFYGSERQSRGSQIISEPKIPLLGKYISRFFCAFSENKQQKTGNQSISEVRIPSITNDISSFLRQLTILRMINLSNLSLVSYQVYEGKQAVIIRGFDFGVNFGLVIKNDGTLMEGMHFLDYHPKGGVDFKTGFKSVFCHETETNYITGQTIRERSLTEKHSDEVKKLLEGDLIAELKIDYQNNRKTDCIYSARFRDNKLHEYRVEDLKIHSSEGLKGRAKNEVKTFKSSYGYFAYRENLPYELVEQEK